MQALELWVALTGILRKEIVRFTRIWPQTLLPSAITAALYFLIFGQVIGSQIGQMDNVSYSLYIAPGLIMMAVITNAYSNVVGSFFGLRFSRAVEELLVSPTPHWMIILGFVGGGVLRGFAVGLIVWIISLVFAGWHLSHPFLAFITMALCGTLFSLAGFLNAMFARKFDDTAIVPTFILTPLIYLGGVFYSVDRLSPVWQYLARINPLHYIIMLFRYAMLGVSGGYTPWGIALAIVLGLVIALFGICLYCFNKGLGLKT